MKSILVGAVLGVLWLFLGLPVTVPATAVAPLVQPVTVAFLLGILAHPHLARRGWFR